MTIKSEHTFECGDSIALKAIQYSARWSEETMCFKANLYWNNKKIAYVENQGRGGENRITPAMPEHRKLFSEIEKKCSDELEDSDLSFWCTEQVAKSVFAKQLKMRVLFKEAGEKGQIIEVSWKGVKKVTSEHVERVRKQHPDATVLNALDFEEAYKVFSTI
ncbi:hypothetical protein ACQU0X_25600 [Pseudovibrio ascidiaceicola]|uniref:hypothetical protein n=1 Tax=Pseudovibrio ascidiaceicola TaxID=285279 RepID=UPI003D368661